MAGNEPISAKPIKTTLLDGAIFYVVEGGVGFQISKADLKTIMAPTVVALGLLHVRDEKAADTDGGTATVGAFDKRDLNTVVTNTITGASLASDQITLPAGTYDIVASTPAFDVAQHKCKLRNTTDSTDELIGTSEFARNANAGDVTRSFIYGRFTIAATKVFEIQHRVSATQAANGLGPKSNYGVIEIYTDVRITKVP